MKIKTFLFLIGFCLVMKTGFSQNPMQDTSAFNLKVLKNMKLTGYIQFRYQNPEQDGKNDNFDIRRARLDLRGIISEQFDYRLQTDFGGGTVKLLDAIITYKPLKEIAFQLGQFKIPLSAENNTPSNKMDYVNRAQVVEALVARGNDVIGSNNGRDIGIQANGALFKNANGSLIDWYVGIFNGQGINVNDVNRSKDISGRIVLRPLHGFSIGGSIYNGYDQPLGTTINQKRNRFAGEISYTYKIFNFQGEFIEGEDGGIKKQGYYASLSCYVIPKTLQMVTRYDYYDKNKSAEQDASTFYLAGLNYNFNENAKLQFNYEVHDEEGVEIKNNIMYAMFQLSF